MSTVRAEAPRGSAAVRTPAEAPRESSAKTRPRRFDRAREERLWRRGAAALAGAALLGWLLAHFLTGDVRPGDAAGTTFGVLATLLLVLAMLYAARRRLMPQASRRRLGLARSWLLLHVYGSLLFLLAVLLHSGLRWPQGLFSWTLWLLSLWAVLSGLAGLVIQRTVPRLLTAGAGLEAHYARIPELVSDIRRRSDELASGGEPPLRLFYSRRMAPVLAAPPRYRTALFRRRRRLETLEHLRAIVSAEERRRIDQLEQLWAAKLDLDTHSTLQHLLRSWLWLHVPPTLLLAAVVVIHVATVLYY